MSQIQAVILAAGKGTRMKSSLPKVLHQILGRPMVQYVIDACTQAGVSKPILVVGHGAEQVREAVGDQANYALQLEQLGTGHAVLQAEALLQGFDGNVLVLCGDTPLLEEATLSGLIRHHRETGAAATVLSAVMENPRGYGRIIRDDNGGVARIVEEKDASPTEQAIREINTGSYCFAASDLMAALKQLTPENAQGEYYLTDVLEILNKKGQKVEGYVAVNPQETMGINDRVQLAQAATSIRDRINTAHMVAGVTLTDPAATYIEPGVEIGPDTVIYPNTHLQQKARIGSGCTVGPNSRIVGSIIGDGTSVDSSIVLDSTVGSKCTIGPFAYLRPATTLADRVKVGDFVELKKSTIGEGSKVPHLSYVGDATVGTGVNIGAGTITCNYDGFNKFQTVIQDNAFIGSNTNLVAPVEVGKGAVVAAGSTLTTDVPEGALGVARGKQRNISGWTDKRPRKN
ncbi:MAG TPA: bifunctional UDP-N-acetylglucosamine diphosphorylase/glucosamine-1-phosphate N-acetyltransferase GlmU [Bacillota bacterium]|nr:bifunctional UDP-N-acetylglucosamine diphosphorylase/glucosamine-1-phosphate N-acetyltransferase GlmU [Bacillota bacterium]